MAFWSDEEIKQQRNLLVCPFREERVKHGAYELSLGNEVYVTGEGTIQKLQNGDSVRVPVGQFALLLTEEEVMVPENAIALISVKSRMKLRGLINVSGFHADPGFRGNLIFSVFNAGLDTLVLRKGDAMFQIWFSDIRQPTKGYDGASQNQHIISSDTVSRLQGVRPTTASVHRDLERLRREIRWLWTILVGTAGLLITIVGAVAGNWCSTNLNIQENRDHPPPQVTSSAAAPKR